MSKRGTSSASSDGSDRGSHRGTEVYRSQPCSGNPRGRGRGFPRRGRGQNRGRNEQNYRDEPRNDLHLFPEQDGRMMGNIHQSQHFHGDLRGAMRPSPTHPPMRPTFQPPYGMPQWQQQHGFDHPNFELTEQNFNIGQGPVPEQYYRPRHQFREGSQARNQPGPNHSRKRPVDKKQANKSQAPHTKNAQKKNSQSSKKNIVNTPPETHTKTQPQKNNAENKTNLHINKNKDLSHVSTEDEVESEFERRSTPETERREGQSSLDNLQTSDTELLQDSKSDEVQNQAGPSHTRKRPVKKQANTSHAPNSTAKISQKKNAHKNKNVIVNTPSQNDENPQPQNNTNFKNKIKDPSQISTKDHVRSDSKTKSTLENERSETQSSLENLQITDTDPLQLQDSISGEVSDDKRTVYKDDELRPPVKVGKTLTLINQSAAKDALVPMKFGIELLNSVTHNNIELVADQGAKIRANTAILSLNSPVIHHMTTTLELLTIDMEEFSEQSVRYFVEAAYTGKLPTVSGEMFRDLNKIAHAFKVTWLQNSCYKMFSEFTDGIRDILPPYRDLLFVFEEAAYVLSRLKKRDFLEVALGKITTSNSKQMFIEKYLEDIGALSDYHLDMVIELAGTEVDLIVQPLKEHLLSKQLGILRDQFVEQKEVEETAISEECKYLLENCDLSSCRRYHPELFEQMFDTLEKLAESKEDMKWVLQLHRKPTNIPDVPTNIPDVPPRPTVQSKQDLEDLITDQKQGKSAESPNPGKKGIWPFWKK